VRFFVAEHPPMVLLASDLLFGVTRTLLYTLIGGLAGGEQGLVFALVGSSALSMATWTVAKVSDVPMWERWFGTYGRQARSGADPFAMFAVRSVPDAAGGAASVLVNLMIVGVVVGHPGVAVRALACSPLLLASVFATTMLGLFAIAPAIASRYDTLTYNLAISVLTVASGAIYPVASIPVVRVISQVLPLTHGIAAVRAAMAGGGWLPQVLAELAVGAGWGVAAWGVYRIHDHRGRSNGTGVYE